MSQQRENGEGPISDRQGQAGSLCGVEEGRSASSRTGKARAKQKPTWDMRLLGGLFFVVGAYAFLIAGLMVMGIGHLPPTTGARAYTLCQQLGVQSPQWQGVEEFALSLVLMVTGWGLYGRRAIGWWMGFLLAFMGILEFGYDAFTGELSSVVMWGYSFNFLFLVWLIYRARLYHPLRRGVPRSSGDTHL